MKLFQKLINLVSLLVLMLIGCLLIGKIINLTSDNIAIKSNNFSVDKNGNMTCANANITDGKVILGSELQGQGSSVFKIYNGSDESYTELYPDSFEIYRENPYSRVYCGLGDDFVGFQLMGADESEIKGTTRGFNVWGPNGSGGTYIGYDKITTPSIQITNAGTCMYGKEEGHNYRCHWTNAQLQFWVDETNVGTLSDKRLKTDIQDIDTDFIKAIEEIEMKQFKVANRNGLISFGILAQDLIEIFKKYGKKPFDYEIVYETQYRTDDDTVYYAINYEQFLILKQKATDKKLEQLQEKDKQKDEVIENLIKRIETLEKEVNK